MRHRLEDVDVSGVHLVGSPANRRQFALVKNLAGRKPEELETMKLTKAEFKKRISTEVEGEIDDAKLASLAKAIGIELTDAPAPKDKTEKTVTPPTGDDDVALVKGIEAVIEKATKPLLDKIEQLEKTNTEAAKVALQKRAKVLKAAGYEIEIEKISEPEVSALEIAHQRVVKAAEKIGLTKAFGSPESEEPTSGAPALQLLVSKKIEEVLGRRPMNKAEGARVRQEIYRSNPGLLSAIVKAEREERARAS